MNANTPVLSAIVIVGSCRDRAQRVVNNLCNQTIMDSIEIIIVDLGPEGSPPITTRAGVRTVSISRPRTEPWARARAHGIKQASAPIVAFIEDHCFPAPTWAAALVDAHTGPWAAIGYGFTNANPQTYISRASMIVDYGLWAHPARRGPARLLPGNNVSYKREALLAFGDRIETVLAPDFNIQETFEKRGWPMFIESRALAAHQNFQQLSGLLHANHAYCRLMATNRVDAQSWSTARRLVYGLAVPLATPALRFLRLLRSLKGRISLLPDVIAALPIILVAFHWAAMGESLGYLFGQGNSEQDFNRWELETERIVQA